MTISTKSNSADAVIDDEDCPLVSLSDHVVGADAITDLLLDPAPGCSFAKRDMLVPSG
jgi:hypothetical protein